MLFLPRDAVLERYRPTLLPCPSVCLCLSRMGVLVKGLNVGLRKQRHMITQAVYSFMMPKNSTVVTPAEGTKWRWGRLKSLNFDLQYLENCTRCIVSMKSYARYRSLRHLSYLWNRIISNLVCILIAAHAS